MGRTVSHHIWSWSNCINCYSILSLQAKVMRYLQDILNILYFLLARDQDPKDQDFKYQFWNDLVLLKLAQRKSKKSTSDTQMMKKRHKNNKTLTHADWKKSDAFLFVFYEHVLAFWQDIRIVIFLHFYTYLSLRK